MEKEFEFVSHPQIQAFHMILVRMTSRTFHSHKELEIGLILDGEMELLQAGVSRHLCAGDMYILNPMELHGIQAMGNGVIILAAQLSQSMVTSFFQHSQNTCFIESAIRPFFTGHETRYDIAKGLFIELGYHYFSQLSNYEYKCMSLLNMIIYSINSYVPRQTLSDAEMTEHQQRENRLTRITDYIEANFQQKLLLQDIADREGLSLSYLSHFFKENIGMTFQDYLNQKRLEYAVGLLSDTDKKILTISIESGFSDVRYLNAVCQKYYHCSASDLRRQRHTGSPSHSDTQKKPRRTSSSDRVTQSLQSFFSVGDSILMLNRLREEYRENYSGYTIWEFFR